MSLFLGRAVSSALSEALSLVLPVSCAGCAIPDAGLCEACRGAMRCEPRTEVLQLEGHPPLEVWWGMSYEAPLPGILRAFKDGGHTSLATALGRHLGVVAHRAYPQHEHVLWACAPSPAANVRQRGYHPLELVAKASRLPVEPVLHPSGVRRDQAGLSREDRWSNVSDTVRASTVARGRRVVILDDVITTGATVLECARALREAGATVLGAVALARTPLRHDSSPGDGLRMLGEFSPNA
jgi:predicted amidophosphoribosyltransferase